MTVNIDKVMLNKQFQKISEKMDQGKDDTVGSITYGIRSPVKNMTYGIAIWGLPKQIWCVNPKFIAAHCTTLYKVNFCQKKRSPFSYRLSLNGIYARNNTETTTTREPPRVGPRGCLGGFMRYPHLHLREGKS